MDTHSSTRERERKREREREEREREGGREGGGDRERQRDRERETSSAAAWYSPASRTPCFLAPRTASTVTHRLSPLGTVTAAAHASLPVSLEFQ
jgi:hypothetical protein